MNGLFTEESIRCPEYEEKYDVLKFNEDLRKRRENHPYTIASKFNKGTVEQLKSDGLALIKGAFSPKKIKKLKQKFEDLSENEKIIKKTKIHRTLKGQHALLNFPEIMEYVCSDVVFDVVSGFYECVPIFSWCKVHKTMFSEKEEFFGTQYFHFDSNSLCVLKAFLYLDDVTDISQGPFIYARGSHLDRFEGWREQENRPGKWRYYDQKIQDYYSDRIQPVYANAGDIIFANTTGFHKAGKISLQNVSRHMLTLHFLIHSEFRRDETMNMPIRKGMISYLPDIYKPLFDAVREV